MRNQFIKPIGFLNVVLVVVLLALIGRSNSQLVELGSATLPTRCPSSPMWQNAFIAVKGNIAIATCEVPQGVFAYDITDKTRPVLLWDGSTLPQTLSNVKSLDFNGDTVFYANLYWVHMINKDGVYLGNHSANGGNNGVVRISEISVKGNDLFIAGQVGAVGYLMKIDASNPGMFYLSHKNI